MKTLKDLIVETRCRKGPAFATTKHGAYWLASHLRDEGIKIRSYGSDGIGNNRPSRWNKLQLRHYRDGSVRAVVVFLRWHQNDGEHSSYVTSKDLLQCETVEDVITTLKGVSHEDCSAYGDNYEKELTDALTNLGMAVSLPAPDEEPSPAP